MVSVREGGLLVKAFLSFGVGLVGMKEREFLIVLVALKE